MSAEEQLDVAANNPSDLSGAVSWPPKLLRLVVGAIIAAVLSYAALKSIYPLFVLPEDVAYVPEQAPIWVYEQHDQAQYEVDGKNFAVVFGLSGALLGACCVLFCFGFRAVSAIVIAAVGTAGLGAVGALLSNWMFNTMRAKSGQDLVILGIQLNGMMQSILGYLLLWCLIGLGMGVGIGIARSASKAVIAGVSGLVGGVLASMIYVVGTSQISIGTIMNKTIPDSSVGQFIWMVTFSVVIAACIALGSGEKQPKAATLT